MGNSHVTIVNDPSSGVKSDAPNCSVTYDRHYDDRNSFIIQATEVFVAKRNFYQKQVIDTNAVAYMILCSDSKLLPFVLAYMRLHSEG